MADYHYSAVFPELRVTLVAAGLDPIQEPWVARELWDKAVDKWRATTGINAEVIWDSLTWEAVTSAGQLPPGWPSRDEVALDGSTWVGSALLEIFHRKA